MAQVTEDLVYNEEHANDGVTNWSNTTTSNDSYGTISATGKYITFGLTNLSQTPTSITSIQHFAEAQCGSAATMVIQHEFLNSSNTQLYTENFAVSTTSSGTGATLTTYSNNVYTTSDGSTAWTESDVNGLRIKVGFSSITNSSATMNLDHLYIDVDYEEPAADTYDKLVQNLHITSGNVYLKSGNVYI